MGQITSRSRQRRKRSICLTVKMWMPAALVRFASGRVRALSAVAVPSVTSISRRGMTKSVVLLGRTGNIRVRAVRSARAMFVLPPPMSRRRMASIVSSTLSCESSRKLISTPSLNFNTPTCVQKNYVSILRIKDEYGSVGHGSTVWRVTSVIGHERWPISISPKPFLLFSSFDSYRPYIAYRLWQSKSSTPQLIFHNSNTARAEEATKRKAKDIR